MSAHKPWFRSHDGWWYATITEGGKRKQVKLIRGEDKKSEAMKLFHQAMATLGDSERVFALTVTVAELFELFLTHAKSHYKSYEWFLWFLKAADKSFGNVIVSQLKPYHVTTWIEKCHPKWSDSSRNRAISCVQAALNYAVDQGVLERSPLSKMKKPQIARRERVLTGEERELLLANSHDDAFKEFLVAMLETGCRVGEVGSVTKANFHQEGGYWLFSEHKTKKKTEKPRIVYLTDAVLALSARLSAKHPDGPLFRNKLGKPWTRNAIRCRFRRMRERIPALKSVVAYTLRHTYITEALARGLSDATVAELVGHANTDMIHKHYSHLSQKTELLRQAARRVVEPLPLKKTA